RGVDDGPGTLLVAVAQRLVEQEGQARAVLGLLDKGEAHSHQELQPGCAGELLQALPDAGAGVGCAERGRGLVLELQVVAAAGNAGENLTGAVEDPRPGAVAGALLHELAQYRAGGQGVVPLTRRAQGGHRVVLLGQGAFQVLLPPRLADAPLDATDLP